MNTKRIFAPILMAAALVAAAPALADGHDYDHRGRDHGRGSERQEARRGGDRYRGEQRWDNRRNYGRSERRGFARGIRPIDVPRSIGSRVYGQYDPYFVRGGWDAGHRHYRSYYRFPVMCSSGVVYRPFVYDDGYLVVPYGARYGYWDDRWDDRVSGYVQFGGPHFHIGIGF